MADKPQREQRPCGEALRGYHFDHPYTHGGVVYECPGGDVRAVDTVEIPCPLKTFEKPHDAHEQIYENIGLWRCPGWGEPDDGVKEPAPPQTYAQRVRDLDLFVVAPESRLYEVRTFSGERHLAAADEVKQDVAWVTLRAGGVLTLSVRATDVRTVRQVDPEEIEHAADADDALAEARSWARHGYEIGQRHCGWSDHGVAPAWLTEGWPAHIDSCEHAARAAEYDTALARVRGLPESPQAVDALTNDPSGYARGYRDAIREAKRAARTEQREATT